MLEVSPKASAEVIRAAYRSLAQRYHPDKNSAVVAAERFAEIHEAYLVLSDPQKRNAYNYRHYTQRPNHAPAVIGTVEELLFETEKLRNDMLARPAYHIDRDILFFRLSDLVAAAELMLHGDVITETQLAKMTTDLIASTRLLPHAMASVILKKLLPLAERSPLVHLRLLSAIRQSKEQLYWNRYKAPAALLLALLLCFLIFLLAR